MNIGWAWPVVMIAVWLIIRVAERRQPAARPPALPTPAAATAVAPVTESPAEAEAGEPEVLIPALTEADEDLLAGVQCVYPDLHPKAVQRGLALADLLRRAAPGASDAELSRGVLHTSHWLAFAAQNLGDPGHFYARLITELDVAALDLTALELASGGERLCDP